mmetsp:Transcript_15476/g.26635  ORF Transcript_15476/g.26635 Transcript_15476/m.26635 type:complete len:224 (+) Transcript_15476:796-1467(+)
MSCRRTPPAACYVRAFGCCAPVGTWRLWTKTPSRRPCVAFRPSSSPCSRQPSRTWTSTSLSTWSRPCLTPATRAPRCATTALAIALSSPASPCNSTVVHPQPFLHNTSQRRSAPVATIREYRLFFLQCCFLFHLFPPFGSVQAPAASSLFATCSRSAASRPSQRSPSHPQPQCCPTILTSVLNALQSLFSSVSAASWNCCPWIHYYFSFTVFAREHPSSQNAT